MKVFLLGDQCVWQRWVGGLGGANGAVCGHCRLVGVGGKDPQQQPIMVNLAVTDNCLPAKFQL